MGDAKFPRYVPDQHVGQVIHQMVVLSVNFFIYVSAAEAGTMYTCVVYGSADNVEKCYKALTDVVLATVSWAHEQDPQPPSFTDTITRRALKSRLPFWLMVNNFVNEKGPFPPLKLFKHASQSLYSKTKGGVDGSAQARAILRSSTPSFKWEQKIVSQTIKTLAVNSFIAWRMTQKRNLLESRVSFQGLNSYRNSLNTLESLADFIYEASRELLNYAQFTETLEVNEVDNHTEISCENLQRLCRLAAARKGRRLLFFNASDGVILRLSVPGHVMNQQKEQQYCSLCGVRGIVGNDDTWPGHRST